GGGKAPAGVACCAAAPATGCGSRDAGESASSCRSPSTPKTSRRGSSDSGRRVRTDDERSFFLVFLPVFLRPALLRAPIAMKMPRIRRKPPPSTPGHRYGVLLGRGHVSSRVGASA